MKILNLEGEDSELRKRKPPATHPRGVHMTRGLSPVEPVGPWVGLKSQGGLGGLNLHYELRLILGPGSPNSMELVSPWASLVVQLVKNLPAMQETLDRFLGQKDPLEKGMATYSSILAWRIPMDRGAWRAAVHGVAKSWT